MTLFSDLIAEEIVAGPLLLNSESRQPTDHNNVHSIMRPPLLAPGPSMDSTGSGSVPAVLINTSAACDHSDTWSVDATASDSDADALRSEDRMREFDDQPSATSSSMGGSLSGRVPSDLATLVVQDVGIMETDAILSTPPHSCAEEKLDLR